MMDNTLFGQNPDFLGKRHLLGKAGEVKTFIYTFGLNINHIMIFVSGFGMIGTIPLTWKYGGNIS